MGSKTLFVAIMAVLFLTVPVFGEEKQLTFEELIKPMPITPSEIKAEKKRKEMEQWQKVKPTGEEWKRWQKGLNQMGRFQGISTGKPVAYVIDTKLWHVWYLYTDRPIKYIGRVFPLKEIGKKILDLP